MSISSAGRTAVAPRAGARIETDPAVGGGFDDRCRSPRGSADRNTGLTVGGGGHVTSLPARERGSKHRQRPAEPRQRLSLPARERGSKQVKAWRSIDRSYGRSPRGSADRNSLYAPARASPLVAPRAGARIETAAPASGKLHSDAVAPRAGARIETTTSTRAFWVCRVAPRAGARIETASPRLRLPCPPRRSPRGSADRNRPLSSMRTQPPGSLPARERGSKHREGRQAADGRASLPARERGSKQRAAGRHLESHQSLPARERGSKPCLARDQRRRRGSLPARERGSKHTEGIALVMRLPGRSPRGSADRNTRTTGTSFSRLVAPRAGARIETA